MLIALPDQTGTGMITGGSTESRAPWNAGAAEALMVPWHELRALEREVRRRAGLTVIARGGSAGNTRESLRAVVRIARALSEEEAAWIMAAFERWSRLTFALNAFDHLPYWLDIPLPRVPDCVWCTTPSLRWSEGYGVVICMFSRCPSRLGRGWAQVITNGHGMRWAWEDGTTQP